MAWRGCRREGRETKEDPGCSIEREGGRRKGRDRYGRVGTTFRSTIMTAQYPRDESHFQRVSNEYLHSPYEINGHGSLPFSPALLVFFFFFFLLRFVFTFALPFTNPSQFSALRSIICISFFFFYNLAVRCFYLLARCETFNDLVVPHVADAAPREVAIK